MPILYKTIGDYVAQDDRVTAVDQYRNAHDVQRFRRNWNSLLARRFRQPSMVQIHDGAQITRLFGIEPVAATKPGDLFGPIMVPVPSQCQLMTLYIRANCEDADTDVVVYPTGIGSMFVPGVSDANFRITVTGTSQADYSCSVRVYESARRDGVGVLWLSCVSEVDIAEGVKDSLAVRASGPNWFDVANIPTAATGSTGAVLVFNGAPELGRYVARAAVPTGTGTEYRIWTTRPLERQLPNTATLNTYEIGTARVRSLSLCPARATDYEIGGSYGIET